MTPHLKPVVTYFQRRPRPGVSFSIEFIFEELRKRLVGQIEARVKTCSCYNDGYTTKLINIIEATFRQSKLINHITGEVHFLNLLMRRRTVILTIHDCVIMTRKTGLTQWIASWLYLKAPIRKARFITTVSETTKREIIQYTGCPADLIRVIPVAVDDRFQPYPQEFNRILPTILHIGTAPNKNLSRLIEALENLPCHLVIVGRITPEIVKALAVKNISYRNHYALSSAELHQLYIECDLLAFASTFEGFGMPIVEANAVERPVLTSNISSMPEIAADAACLIDPYDVNSIRAGLEKIISDEAYRNQLLANGRRNKLRFDAMTVAKQYYHLYSQMVD